MSNWDVSKVANMGDMFSHASRYLGSLNIGDISKWDTSNVTNMLRMFKECGQNGNWHLDLSSWNVDKVVDHTDFDLNVEDKIVSPIWKS